MGEVFVHREVPRFVWFTNYKAMFSSVYFSLMEHFPDVERNVSLPDGDDSDEFLTLAVVRDPYNRLESLYRDKCMIDPEMRLTGRRPMLLQPSQGQILQGLNELRGRSSGVARVWEDLSDDPEEATICTGNFDALKEVTFEEFVDVARIVLRRPDPDPHFQPQHVHLMRKGVLAPKHIFRMENITKGWVRICGMLGVSMPLRRDNVASMGGKGSLYSNGLKDKAYALYR